VLAKHFCSGPRFHNRMPDATKPCGHRRAMHAGGSVVMAVSRSAKDRAGIAYHTGKGIIALRESWARVGFLV
jgi:hypothetical protein